MKHFDWDPEKNEKLKRERDISFEDFVIAFEDGRVVAVEIHPNKRQYPGQKLYVVVMREYAYLVPFVEDDEKIFLKTIFLSRRATARYIKIKKL